MQKLLQDQIVQIVNNDGEKIIINNIEEANTYKNTVGKTREEFIEYMKSNTEDSTKIKCKQINHFERSDFLFTVLNKKIL